MYSHSIPNSSDEDGEHGAQNDPNVKIRQVSYRPSLSSQREIRRAGEQTSPQVARAVGHPAQRVKVAG